MMLLKKSLQKIRGRIRSVQCIESLGDLFCEGLIYTLTSCTFQVQNGYYCMPCTVLITNGKSRLCSHVTPKQCRGFLMYKIRRLEDSTDNMHRTNTEAGWDELISQASPSTECLLGLGELCQQCSVNLSIVHRVTCRNMWKYTSMLHVHNKLFSE